MKKLFLILLILPIGLLADDWIFSVENTTMVTAYFNIFNAIAALFKNDNYIDLLRLAFLVGGFFVFVIATGFIILPTITHYNPQFWLFI